MASTALKQTDLDYRIMLAIKEGCRTLADIKARLRRREVPARVRALKASGDLKVVDGMLKVAWRGAGRMRCVVEAR